MQRSEVSEGLGGECHPRSLASPPPPGAPLLLEPTSCHHLQTRPPQGWEGRDQGWEALVYRYEEHMCFLILP